MYHQLRNVSLMSEGRRYYSLVEYRVLSSLGTSTNSSKRTMFSSKVTQVSLAEMMEATLHLTWKEERTSVVRRKRLVISRNPSTSHISPKIHLGS